MIMLSYVLSENDNDGGIVFAVIFENGARETFAMSTVVIGEGVMVVKPLLEGEWNGIRIFSTQEPCLSIVRKWKPFIPMPMPETV